MQPSHNTVFCCLGVESASKCTFWTAKLQEAQGLYFKRKYMRDSACSPWLMTARLQQRLCLVFTKSRVFACVCINMFKTNMQTTYTCKSIYVYMYMYIHIWLAFKNGKFWCSSPEAPVLKSPSQAVGPPTQGLQGLGSQVTAASSPAETFVTGS